MRGERERRRVNVAAVVAAFFPLFLFRDFRAQAAAD